MKPRGGLVPLMSSPWLRPRGGPVPLMSSPSLPHGGSGCGRLRPQVVVSSGGACPPADGIGFGFAPPGRGCGGCPLGLLKHLLRRKASQRSAVRRWPNPVKIRPFRRHVRWEKHFSRSVRGDRPPSADKTWGKRSAIPLSEKARGLFRQAERAGASVAPALFLCLAQAACGKCRLCL